MTRLEYLKTLTETQAGRYVCDEMEELMPDDTKFVCDECPWTRMCGGGINGLIAWMHEEVKEDGR